MESAVIIYHKNALNFYEHRWLFKCLDSIEKQTYQKFDIFELAYGNEEKEISIVEYFNKLKNNKLFFYKKEYKNHSYALNFLLNKVFSKKNNYKYCFNINIDDFYDINRFERQIKILKKLPYDLVSSNMYYIDENNKIINNIDYLSYKFTNKKPILKQIEEEQKYIRNEFKKNHNIIAHPCVCYTRRFWDLIKPYKNIIPEDLELLKRASENINIKMHISNKNLLYYRIHQKQTVQQKEYKNNML